MKLEQRQRWISDGGIIILKSDGMGCDIHCYLEFRTAADQPWTFLMDPPCPRCWGTKEILSYRNSEDGEMEQCWNCGGSGVNARHIEKDDDTEYKSGGEVYSGRNYGLFAILTGSVRNYWNYVALYPEEERGVPEDATEEFKEIAENPDHHSPNHLDLDELTAAIVHGEHFFTHDVPLEQGETSRGAICGSMVSGTIEKVMRPLAEKYGNKNVRLVFCFDN